MGPRPQILARSVRQWVELRSSEQGTLANLLRPKMNVGDYFDTGNPQRFYPKHAATPYAHLVIRHADATAHDGPGR